MDTVWISQKVLFSFSVCSLIFKLLFPHSFNFFLIVIYFLGENYTQWLCSRKMGSSLIRQFWICLEVLMPTACVILRKSFTLSTYSVRGDSDVQPCHSSVTWYFRGLSNHGAFYLLWSVICLIKIWRFETQKYIAEWNPPSWVLKQYFLFQK